LRAAASATGKSYMHLKINLPTNSHMQAGSELKFASSPMASLLAVVPVLA
jgi:hypothetical protein